MAKKILPVRLKFTNVAPDNNITLTIHPETNVSWSLGKNVLDNSGFVFSMDENQPSIISEIELSYSTLFIATTSSGARTQNFATFSVSLFIEVEGKVDIFRGRLIINEEASVHYSINNSEEAIWENGVVDAAIETI